MGLKWCTNGPQKLQEGPQRGPWVHKGQIGPWCINFLPPFNLPEVQHAGVFISRLPLEALYIDVLQLAFTLDHTST